MSSVFAFPSVITQDATPSCNVKYLLSVIMTLCHEQSYSQLSFVPELSPESCPSRSDCG